MQMSQSARRAQLLEMMVLFGGGPLVVAVLPPWAVLPAIWAAALGCGYALRRLNDVAPAGWDERLRGPRARWVAQRLVPRTALGCLALYGLALAVLPRPLWSLPRTLPGLWAALMLGYALLSAYPQEVVFRRFFWLRYRDLFGTARARVWASAAAFGFAHVVLHNALAVGLSFVGGLLFADTYRRSRSLRLVALEHAVYGAFLFTVGYGSVFYAGAARSARGRAESAVRGADGQPAEPRFAAVDGGARP